MGHEAREVWAKRVERWLESGLTLKEYASEVGVNPHTLAGWRWRLSLAQRTTAVPTFVEVVSTPEARTPSAGRQEAAGSEPLELVLRDGHRIRIPVHFDAGALRRVVEALGTR